MELWTKSSGQVPGTSGSIGNGILGEYFPEREYNLLGPKKTRKRPKFQPWASQFFERTEDTKTRGHNLKLKKTRVKSKARSKFFSNRVVTARNKLPKEVVMANSTNEFKNRLDRFRTETTLSSLFQVTQ